MKRGNQTAVNWIALNQDMWSQTKACINKSECVEDRKEQSMTKDT